MVNHLSLYFHIPFCTHKCPYCHFYVIPNTPFSKELLLEGLQIEWNKLCPQLSNHKIVTIYFGGGTPTLIGADAIKQLLDAIPYDKERVEVTIEANPEELSLPLLSALKCAGINRISLGVQAFDNQLLQILGRRHSAKCSIEAVERIYLAGIENISIDLMYDLPNQTLPLFEASLCQAIKLPITHFSLYNLTIEPNTLFYKQRKELSKRLPDPETSAKFYLQARTFLEEAGFQQYEISAFAKTGYNSQHNSGYWMGRPFLGFGPSSWSYFKNRREQNTPNIQRWYKALKEGESPIEISEILPKNKRQRELLALQFRLRVGVVRTLFEQQYGPLEQETKDTLAKLITEELIEENGDRLRLTERGVLFYDTVAAALI